MSKLTKLLLHPLAFFQDAAGNRFGWTFGKKPPKKKPKSVPSWFQADAGPELSQALRSSKPLFLYVPWIAEHGDRLIGRIRDAKHYNLAPLDFIRNVDDNEVRRSVLNFARASPQFYRRMLARRLVPLSNRVSGLIFTFDWAPVMRIVANVCEELEIPRILIPHESVFVARDKYYVDPTARASTPIADIILGWGGLQREIFAERGYPAHRFKAVGAPKFDPYRNYRAQLSRNRYGRLFGLDPARKIILFCSQPLDSQLDIQVARKSQCDAIGDLLDFAEAKGLQLIVRLPPSKDNILEPLLQARLEQSPSAAIDDALCYLVPPEEALYHADLVTSVNSTMLFEGLLVGRPSLSVKYVEFDSLWARAGIPAANNRDELFALMEKMLFSAEPWQPRDEGIAWAARMFSNGSFDGRAHARIKNYLRKVVEGQIRLALRPGGVERIVTRHLGEGKVNIVACPLPEEAQETTWKHLTRLLNARVRLDSSAGMADIRKLASVDVFVQWGARTHPQQAEVQSALGRLKVIVDRGFLRSAKGHAGELSVWLDDTTSHYDATRPTRLQRLLESDWELSPEQLDRCRRAIGKIVQNRISRENTLPWQPLTIGTAGRRKVLVIDQLKGDETLAYSLADAASFPRMLREARLHVERDIVILYPPALEGPNPGDSHLSEAAFPEVKSVKNLCSLSSETNSRALLDLVDEVYTVNSHLGFEALLLGKTVHCFGAPFYAGWGITQDHLPIPGRTRRRSLEEVFWCAYIEGSRYFHPRLNRVVEIEDAIDYILAQSQTTSESPSQDFVGSKPNSSGAASNWDEEADFDSVEQGEETGRDLPQQEKYPASADQTEDVDLDFDELPNEDDFELLEEELETESLEAEPGQTDQGEKGK